MSVRHALAILCTLAILVLPDLPACAGADRFGFVAPGDMPYTLPRDLAAFERLIRRINEIKPLFTVFFQADPWRELDGREDQRSGFSDVIAALRAGSMRFGRPVLIVHGDRHRLVIDQPLMGPGSARLANVTRVMVHGDKEVHGILLNVDPQDPDLFSYKPVYVRENMPVFPPTPSR